MKFSPLPFAGALSVIALMGLGCNPVASLTERVQKTVVESAVEKAMEQNAGGDVDVDLGGSGKSAVTFRDEKTGDYTAWGEDVEVPAEFPSDVPRLNGTKVIQVMLSKQGKTASLSFTSTDGFDRVAEQMDAAVKAQGYTRTGIMEASTEARVLTYEKESLTLAVTVATSGDTDEPSVLVTVVRQEKE
jgi:hypothetical protein